MKFLIFLFSLIYTLSSFASPELEKYIRSFDYEARKDMKMHSKTLIELIKKKRVVLIDIRFPEEYQTWHVDTSINIPLNKLPKKINFIKNEIDKDKLIVTACPHKDRAIIAMIYLRSKGMEAYYLVDGLNGLMENLRGDDAKAFQKSK